MTTPTAASNGSTTTTDTASGSAGKPERATGMAQVREAEVYHVASVMNEAVTEAALLCAVMYRAISDAYFKDVRRSADSEGRTAAEVADSPEIRGKAQEALNCLHAAEQYVRRLLADPQPPF
jgi:hypothetical protein